MMRRFQLLRCVQVVVAAGSFLAFVVQAFGQGTGAGNPSITSICPTAVAVFTNPGQALLNVDIYGSGLANTVAYFDGKPVTTTADGQQGNNTHIIASIPESSLEAPLQHTLQAVNPDSTTVDGSNTVAFNVLDSPAITSLSPVAVTVTAPFTLTITGANFIPEMPAVFPATTACAAGTQLFIAGKPNTAAVVQSSTQITLPFQTNPFQPGQVNAYLLNDGTTPSGPAAFTVNPLPAITSPASLPSGLVGTPYPPTLVTVSGGTPPFVWSLSPSGTGLSLSGSGSQATLTGTPATTGANDTVEIQISVVDFYLATTTGSYSLSVLPAPAVNLALPLTITPGTSSPQQLTITVPANYPEPITGTLEITFAGSPDLKVNPNTPDESLALSSAQFTVPGPPVLITPGTAAGTITVKATSVSVNGIDVDPSTVIPVSTTLVAAAPEIDTCVLTRTTFGFHIRASGFSSTREVTSGTFAFTPANGATLTNSTVTLDNAASIFGPFYTTFTGPFAYDQDLLVSGLPQDIASISIALANGIGASAIVNCQ